MHTLLLLAQVVLVGLEEFMAVAVEEVLALQKSLYS
jgi:hypothetical protein